MQDNAAPAGKRGLIDRVAVGVLIAAVVLGIGAGAMLAAYLNRVHEAAGDLRRVPALADYPGRPAPVTRDGATALNFLITTSSGDGQLRSLVIAHLSASRRQLTLIAVPAELADAGGRTLAASYHAEPAQAARAVEDLTGARMDHQVHLNVAGLGPLVDSLGGLKLGGNRASGAQVVAAVGQSPSPQARSLRTAELLRAGLAEASMGMVLTDPMRFDRMLAAVPSCVAVDAELTAELIRDTTLESRVHADEIYIWALPTAWGRSGSLPEPQALRRLQAALGSDDLTGLADSFHPANQPSPQPTR